jgi:hypothetical protein
MLSIYIECANSVYLSIVFSGNSTLVFMNDTIGNLFIVNLASDEFLPVSYIFKAVKLNCYAQSYLELVKSKELVPLPR